jgi:hypothetical protein
MIITHVLALVLLATPAIAAPAVGNKPVASGPVKSYRGPEGAQIITLEVNDSKQMLVQYRSVGGGLADGKTELFLFRDNGNGKKDVYTVKKRGSKSYEAYVLVAKDNYWTFYHPLSSTSFELYYSKADSEKLKADDIIKAYRP